MKKIILSALAYAACLAAAAQVQWLGQTHDFGAFGEDVGPVTCDFIFTNTGSEAVTVTGARANCGCTEPRYSREPVAPGARDVISVSYDPSGRPGRFEKFISVSFSDGTRSPKLKITGTVVGSPATVAQRYPVDAGGGLLLSRGAVMIGDVSKGAVRQASIQGYNRSMESLTPAFEGLPDYISVTPVPPTVPAGEQVSMTFFFDGARCPLYGLVSDSVRIVPAPGAPSFTLPVMALVSEDFTRLTPGEMAKAPVARLSADRLDFGTLERSGEPVTLTLNLRNDGKRPLEVRRIYTADAGIAASCSATKIKHGKSATISIAVDPTALRGALLNARINLITNDPSSPTRTIRAVGELR